MKEMNCSGTFSVEAVDLGDCSSNTVWVADYNLTGFDGYPNYPFTYLPMTSSAKSSSLPSPSVKIVEDSSLISRSSHSSSNNCTITSGSQVMLAMGVDLYFQTSHFYVI